MIRLKKKATPSLFAVLFSLTCSTPFSLAVEEHSKVNFHDKVHKLAFNGSFKEAIDIVIKEKQKIPTSFSKMLFAYISAKGDAKALNYFLLATSLPSANEIATSFDLHCKNNGAEFIVILAKHALKDPKLTTQFKQQIVTDCLATAIKLVDDKVYNSIYHLLEGAKYDSVKVRIEQLRVNKIQTMKKLQGKFILLAPIKE